MHFLVVGMAVAIDVAVTISEGLLLASIMETNVRSYLRAYADSRRNGSQNSKGLLSMTAS